VTVARSAEQLEALRDRWRAGSVEAELDYFLAVARSRSEVIRPHVVRLGEDHGGAMFVARLERVPLETSIGYRKVYAPSVRALTQVHGGLTGADDSVTAHAIVRELRAELARGQADVVRLPCVRTGGPLEAALADVPFLQLQHRVAPRTRWGLRLPGSYDEFLQSCSKSTRKSIKVYGRRFEKMYGDEIGVQVFRRPEHLDAIVRDLTSVAAKTYQHGLGVAYGDSDEDIALTRLALDRDWFRAYVLTIADTPVAFWHGMAYGGTFSVQTPGYDPAYREHRIGIYLLLRVIEDLCRDEHIGFVDYGFGEAGYKRQYGNESWEERDVLLYAPSFRAARINVARTAVLATAAVAREGLTRLGLLERVKRRWRGSMTSASTEA
jgi:CelD/BcsL family acetyltransferase involved in cellulose biosynthesis